MQPRRVYRLVGIRHFESISLSALQCETIIELAIHGGGGRFAQDALSELCRLGLVEVHPVDRKVVLTSDGAEIYRQLTAGS